MSTGASIAESSLKPKNMAGVDFTNTPLTDQLKESAHEAIDEVAVKVGKTENELRAKAASFGEALEKSDIPLNQQSLKIDSIEAELKSYVTKTAEFIQAHPYISLGLAFTAGMLLPRLLKDK